MVVPFSEEPAIQTQPELYDYTNVDLRCLEDSCQFENGDNVVQMKTEIRCVKRLVSFFLSFFFFFFFFLKFFFLIFFFKFFFL